MLTGSAARQALWQLGCDYTGRGQPHGHRHTHRWRVHDLVLWDNRCTMHRGTDYDDTRWKRDMHRATVADCANSCEQEGIDSA